MDLSQHKSRRPGRAFAYHPRLCKAEPLHIIRGCADKVTHLIIVRDAFPHLLSGILHSDTQHLMHGVVVSTLGLYLSPLSVYVMRSDEYK